MPAVFTRRLAVAAAVAGLADACRAAYQEAGCVWCHGFTGVHAADFSAIPLGYGAVVSCG